jgi:predicted nucleic acid-binding protein
MIVVDSGVWIDYFNGMITPQTNQLDILLSTNIIIVGDLIITEVLQGFCHDSDYSTAKNLLESLEFRDMVGKEIALVSAGYYRTLRQQGITVRKTIDMLIGSFCIVNQLPLLYADKDFNHLIPLGLISVI